VALLADLQQQRPQVVAVLLDDGVGVAGDPDVVLMVDEAAVQPENPCRAALSGRFPLLQA